MVLLHVSENGAENGRCAGQEQREQEGADCALPRVGAVELLVERVRPGPAAAGVDGDRRDAAVHRRVGVRRARAERQASSDRGGGAPRRRTIAVVRRCCRPADRRPPSASRVTWPGLFQRGSRPPPLGRRSIGTGSRATPAPRCRGAQIDLDPRLERDRVHRRAAADAADVERRARPRGHRDSPTAATARPRACIGLACRRRRSCARPGPVNVTR